MRFSTAVISSYAAILASAHPGQDPTQELMERRQFLSNVKRADLNHCGSKLKARGIEDRAVQRRKEIAQRKSKSGFIKRDLSDLNKSHLSGAGYTIDTPLDTIFAANSSCVLSPEEIEGPYYVAGEYIRQDIVEDQQGVPLVVDIAIFDVDTCEPISDVYLEIWHCNSTGIYSAVGSGGDYSDAPENLANSFLRGLQQTDADGAVQFDSIFPGHYSGRTPHIHVMVHPNATARENGTVVDTTANHVGQMYFDQALIDEVRTLGPYSTNEQPFTTNAQDFLLADGLETSDPIMQYVLLGDSVEEGLLAWLSFGVNTTYSTTVRAATTWQEGGAVENENAGGDPWGDLPSGFPTNFPAN